MGLNNYEPFGLNIKVEVLLSLKINLFNEPFLKINSNLFSIFDYNWNQVLKVKTNFWDTLISILSIYNLKIGFYNLTLINK